jgi:hypothetical protein
MMSHVSFGSFTQSQKYVFRPENNSIRIRWVLFVALHTERLLMKSGSWRNGYIKTNGLYVERQKTDNGRGLISA